MNPEYLIGKKFRRNVYGLSKWTQTIQEVKFILSFTTVKDKYFYEPKLMVKGNNHWYSIDEIVICF